MLLEADFQPVGDTSWFASDADGHVGFFAVFGNGRLPVHALSDDSVLDDLTKFFIGAHTTPEPKERRASGTDEWTAMANCGIFAFDGNPPARAPSYRLVASPARPVLVAD